MYADDQSIIGGLARFNGTPCMVIGHQKGRDTKEKIKRNFGMPKPEGYRKALRLMKMAERFGLPVLTLIDTAGAWPGIDAESRGQSEAIARNLIEMAELKVPIICTVIGEGGSGGALALGVGDRGRIVSAAADRFVAAKDEIARAITIQMGRPLRYTPGEVAGFEARARHMISIADAALAPIRVPDQAGFTRFISREPIGVALTATPSS
ncbi:hypothetical protein G6F31_018002 [Rhizopus arrhizus]|nr:hypothetical protein G6F31_018002 [Rhizopus arrhizus]